MEQWLLFPSEPFSCPTIWVLVYLPTCPLAQWLGGCGSGDTSALTHTAHCPLVHSLVLSPSHSEGV